MVTRRRKVDYGRMYHRPYVNYRPRHYRNAHTRPPMCKDPRDRLRINREISRAHKSLKGATESIYRFTSSLRGLIREFGQDVEANYNRFRNAAFENPFTPYGLLLNKYKVREKRKTISAPPVLEFKNSLDLLDQLDPSFQKNKFSRVPGAGNGQRPAHYSFARDPAMAATTLPKGGQYFGAPGNSGTKFNFNKRFPANNHRDIAFESSRSYRTDYVEASRPYKSVQEETYRAYKSAGFETNRHHQAQVGLTYQEVKQMKMFEINSRIDMLFENSSYALFARDAEHYYHHVKQKNKKLSVGEKNAIMKILKMNPRQALVELMMQMEGTDEDDSRVPTRQQTKYVEPTFNPAQVSPIDVEAGHQAPIDVDVDDRPLTTADLQSEPQDPTDPHTASQNKVVNLSEATVDQLNSSHIPSNSFARRGHFTPCSVFMEQGLSYDSKRSHGTALLEKTKRKNKELWDRYMNHFMYLPMQDTYSNVSSRTGTSHPVSPRTRASNPLSPRRNISKKSSTKDDANQRPRKHMTRAQQLEQMIKDVFNDKAPKAPEDTWRDLLFAQTDGKNIRYGCIDGEEFSDIDMEGKNPPNDQSNGLTTPPPEASSPKYDTRTPRSPRSIRNSPNYRRHNPIPQPSSFSSSGNEDSTNPQDTTLLPNDLNPLNNAPNDNNDQPDPAQEKKPKKKKKLFIPKHPFWDRNQFRVPECYRGEKSRSDVSPSKFSNTAETEDLLMEASTESAVRAFRKAGRRPPLKPYDDNDHYMLTDCEDYVAHNSKFGRVYYSPKLQGQDYMYRFVALSVDVQQAVEALWKRTSGKKRLLTEYEIIKELGIQMSSGWTHYMLYKNTAKELILRKPL